MSNSSLTSVTSASNGSSFTDCSERCQQVDTVSNISKFSHSPADVYKDTPRIMRQVEKSSIACQSLSWDSFPLRNLANQNTESITFTEIEKFLQSDASSLGDLQKWQRVGHQKLSTSTPNQSEISKVLIDRSDLVDISSLLLALPDFGLNPSESQLRMLKDKIPVQQGFFAKFGDFVDCVKEIFHSHLKENCYPSGLPNFEKVDDQVAPELDCRNCAVMKQDVKKLKIHVQQLKNRLSRIERFCSDAEQKLLKSGKELNIQIGCTRKLTEQLNFEVQCKMSALYQAKDGEMKLKASEEKFQSELDCYAKDQAKFEENISRQNVELKREINKLESINETYKDTITKVLKFLLSLCDTLKQTSQTPNTKVGRSFSLYRNATVTSAGQCAIPRGAVLRAASVCTSARPQPPGSNAASSAKGLDGTKNVTPNRFASLIKQSEDIIFSVKKVLQDQPGDRLQEDVKIRRSSSSNRPLQNLPESTVVTVMSMV